jgi:hypothetical protein
MGFLFLRPDLDSSGKRLGMMNAVDVLGGCVSISLDDAFR